MAGISINFKANVEEALRGTSDVGTNLDEIRGKLKQLADDSVKTYLEMTDAQKKAFSEQYLEHRDFFRASDALVREQRDNEKYALDELERNVDKTYDEITVVVDDASEKVARSSRDGFEETGRAASDAGTTVREDLVGAVRELDGTAESAARAAGDALGGLASLIPGIGGLIGAGLGVALSEGIDLFTRQVEEDAKASEDRISSMYDAFIESGLNYLTQSQRISAIDAILGDPEKRKQAEKDAKLLGVTIAEVLNAEIEAGPQREALLERANELRREELKLIKAGSTSYDTEANSERIADLQKVGHELKELDKEQATATTTAEAYRSAVDLSNKTLLDQGRLLDDNGEKLLALPKDVDVKVNLTVDPAAARRNIQRALDSIDDVIVNVVGKAAKYGRDVK